MKEKYFKLYAFNIPVKGVDKSAIYNLQKKFIRLIPNSMYEIIESLNNNPVEKVKLNLSEEDKIVFEEYLYFLIENDFGFYTTHPENFPAINLNWFSPEKIKIAVIETDFHHYDLKKLIDELDDLLCKHMEIRIVKSCSKEEIERWMEYTNNKIARSISLCIKYHPSLDQEFLSALHNRFKKIDRIIIYESPFELDLMKKKQYVFWKKISEKDFFTTSYPKEQNIVSVCFFTEALQYNPYYNKKVCISKIGEIKNCLLHEKSFGNFNDRALKDVVFTNEFQELWHISHDKIEDVCTSELRYSMIIPNNLVKQKNGMYKIAN